MFVNWFEHIINSESNNRSSMHCLNFNTCPVNSLNFHLYQNLKPIYLVSYMAILNRQGMTIRYHIACSLHRKETGDAADFKHITLRDILLIDRINCFLFADLHNGLRSCTAMCFDLVRYVNHCNMILGYIINCSSVFFPTVSAVFKNFFAPHRYF